MKKQSTETTHAAHHISSNHEARGAAHVLHAARDGAARAANGTGKIIQRHPLAAMGIAFGGGTALGAYVYRLMTRRFSH